ncbi:MAG: hypothetical protein RIK87_20145 [Fuerstiella sp.]
MKYTAVRLMLVTMIAGLSGCTTICDEVIETDMGIRNRVLAQKAWGHWSWCYDELEHPFHFARGFRAGYRNVLEGGSGCQPTLPPQWYWKPCFQTPEGRCKTYAWFDGYSHGALAAKQDGYGDLGEIPISPTARTNLQLARSQPTQQSIYGDVETGSYLPVPSGEEDPLAVPGLSLPNQTEPLISPPAVRGRPYE